MIFPSMEEKNFKPKLLVLIFSLLLSLGTVLLFVCWLTCPHMYELGNFNLKDIADDCTSYTFKATSSRMTFNDARAECLEMGGDLLQTNFGPNGTKYHKEIRQLAVQYTSKYKTAGMWVGYTDLEREGSWKSMNEELYDANNNTQAAVAYWGEGEPNNDLGNEQNCAKLWRRLVLWNLMMYSAICLITTVYVKLKPTNVIQ